MSVHYSKIHDVDVPVTDLDDREDDYNTDLRQPFDPLEGLDYEETLPVEQEQQEQGPGFFGYIKQAFTPTPEPTGLDWWKTKLRPAEERIRGAFGMEERESETPPTGVQWWASKVRNAGRSLRSTESYEMQDLGSESSDNTINDRILGQESGPLRNKKTITSLLILATMAMTLLFLFFNENPFAFQDGSQSPILKTILSNSTHDFHPTTIVISLDGFHPHYINPKLTPSLHNMMLHEFGAPYMTPSFPSSTFPNHWTLVTGLYPSEHGIVGNTFYDPVLDKQFVNTNPKVGGLDPDFWTGGEPIWATAKRQGVNSAIHMWPGSEVPGVGIGNGPLHVDRYNGSEKLSSKVGRVMTWLDTPKISERPELILTYVPTIDLFGHKYGIAGKELEEALTYVDDFVDLLQHELKNRNLQDIANVIIVSDHGMAPTDNERLLYLDDILDLNKIEHIDGWPLFGLRPYEKYSVDEIMKELKVNLETEKHKDHFTIYKVEDLPLEWNFGGSLDEHKFNYRLAPLWIVPQVGYSVTTHKQMKDNGYEYKPKGVHGYNNTELLMRAVFLGQGPYFDQQLMESKRIKPFANTEVYNLICDSLGLLPAPNNGTFVTDRTTQDNSFTKLLSSSNSLPQGWMDLLEYPNVPFKVDHVVNDATYDLLWKKPQRKKPQTVEVSTNTDPLASLDKQSTLASISQHIPKPTDWTNQPAPTTSTESSPEVVDSPESGDDDKHSGQFGWLGKIGELLEDLTDDIGDFVGDVAGQIGDAIGSIFDGNQ